MTTRGLAATDLGVLRYADALTRQHAEWASLFAERDSASPRVGMVLALEHPPVITVSQRPTAASNLLASPDHLASLGVEVERTDRGGDITYHGPGQLILYPIVDLNRLGLGIHGYMRLLEETVILTLRDFGVEGRRDPEATGVWVSTGNPRDHTNADAKVAAMGVRVRKWISMHGLSLNVSPNLEHFGLIVPCGLPGRAVTSLDRLLPGSTPAMHLVKSRCVYHFDALVGALLAQRT